MVVYSETVSLFATICAALVSIVGFSGNLFTFFALIRYRKLRSNPTTAFVLSLTASDLLFCMITMPIMSVRFLYQRWTMGEVVCQMFPFFLYGTVAVSVLSMVGLTINRYTIILHPKSYTKVYTRLRLALQLFIVWTFPFSIMTMPLLGIWGHLGLDEETFSCTVLKNENSSPKKFIFLTGFVLPCVAMSVCYSCIFYAVRRQRKTLESYRSADTSLAKPTVRSKEDCRLTITMLSIFLCFMICFLPLTIANVIDDEGKYPNLHVFASILTWFSSVINPIIYALGSQNYRQAFKNLLYDMGCCMGSKPPHSVPKSIDELQKTRSVHQQA